jgi:hypothetical protein
MEYALPAGMFAGVLFFFWGISTMLSGGGAGSVEERMARYAGGKADVKTTGAGRRETRQRNLVDPFATLSSDVQDKRFQIRVQRDLSASCWACCAIRFPASSVRCSGTSCRGSGSDGA